MKNQPTISQGIEALSKVLPEGWKREGSFLRYEGVHVRLGRGHTWSLAGPAGDDPLNEVDVTPNGRYRSDLRSQTYRARADGSFNWKGIAQRVEHCLKEAKRLDGVYKAQSQAADEQDRRRQGVQEQLRNLLTTMGEDSSPDRVGNYPVSVGGVAACLRARELGIHIELKDLSVDQARRVLEALRG